MVGDETDPGDLLASLAEVLLQERDFPHTAEQVVVFARETLTVDYAGITVMNGDGGDLVTTAASDPVVEKADQLQVELDEGPCRDAAWHQHTLVVADLSTDDRWPRWTPRATTLGLSSILAVEMTLRDRPFAALNLYCARPRRFDADEIAFAHLFGRHAAVALAAARKEDTLAEAVDARTLIGQAQGILMERFGLDANQAFDVLRRYSQDNNTKLRAVAEHVVSNRTLPA
jgi:GAF domain-containing protein